MQNTWRDNLRPASWRGVPFEVSADEAEFGRNVVVHEFVQRDKPYVEDLGRKTRRLRFDAWICANTSNSFDPWPQRDALIAAVEQGGVGTLVHPFYGSLQGHIPAVQVKQASAESGGFISLSMEFVEAGDLDFKATQATDTQAQIDDAALGAELVAQDEFADQSDLQAIEGFVLQDMLDMMDDFVSLYDSLQAQQASDQDASAAQLARTALQSPAVLKTPQALAAHVLTLSRLVQSPVALMQFDRPTLPTLATTARQRQQSNTLAFVHLVRTGGVIAYTLQSANLPAQSARYTVDSTRLRATPALITRAEMQALRLQVTTAVTDQVLAMSAARIYSATQSALVTLRTAAVQHMTAQGESLARTFVTSCCEGTGWWAHMPTLVLAYRHYGLLTDDAINTRNEISNPLFISPNAAIELLHEVA